MVMGRQPSVLQSFMESILEFANEAIVTVDSKGLITLFNPAAERIFGYKEAEVLGRSLEILIPPSLRTLHEQHVLRFIASPELGRGMGHRREIVDRVERWRDGIDASA